MAIFACNAQPQCNICPRCFPQVHARHRYHLAGAEKAQVERELARDIGRRCKVDAERLTLDVMECRTTAGNPDLFAITGLDLRLDGADVPRTREGNRMLYSGCQAMHGVYFTVRPENLRGPVVKAAPALEVDPRGV